MSSAAVIRAASIIPFAAAAFLAGCADAATLAPDVQADDAGRGGAVVAMAAEAAPGVDLGSCANLQVPAGSTFLFRAYAEGVQIYQWNGASWSFVAPAATLFADAQHASVVGTHYAGPTWESVSGSKVVAGVLDRCTPDASAIQWLKLGAVTASGPGLFEHVAFIQRVNTVGGIAPSQPGSFVGEEARVAYTTEYIFYRAP